MCEWNWRVGAGQRPYNFGRLVFDLQFLVWSSDGKRQINR